MAPTPTEIYTLSLHDALPIFEFVFPARFVLELALRLRGLQRRAAKLVLDHLRAVEPVLDVIALHEDAALVLLAGDRKSTRLNSSHSQNSYAVFCLKKKKIRRA